MDFLTNLNLTKNQLQNALMHPLGTAPPGVESQVYYNLTDHLLYVHNGTTWVAVGAPYTLPIASDTVLGGIKVGSGLSIDGNGVLTVSAGEANVIEIVQVNGSALTVTNETVNITITTGDTNGTLKVNGTDVAVKGLASGAYAAAYVHPTGDGNLHVPANSTTNTGKVLTASGTAGVYTWETPSVAWANISNKPTSAVADIDNAVSLRHTQNTDTGTTSSTFAIDSDGTTNGVLLKTSTGELQLRNLTDATYADLRIKNLYVEGTQTIINSNEVNIGDSQILLNADITTNAANSDGGIAVKRLMADNTTEKNAVLEYNNSTNKWQTTFGAVTGTLVTLPLTNKYTTTLGDGAATSFVVTHNLNTRDIAVTIRETGDDYEQVMADVKFTSTNTLTVVFATAPASAQYTITAVG